MSSKVRRAGAMKGFQRRLGQVEKREEVVNPWQSGKKSCKRWEDSSERKKEQRVLRAERSSHREWVLAKKATRHSSSLLENRRRRFWKVSLELAGMRSSAVGVSKGKESSLLQLEEDNKSLQLSDSEEDRDNESNEAKQKADIGERENKEKTQKKGETK